MKFQLKYSNMYVNELLSRSFIIDKLKNKGMYKILDIKRDVDDIQGEMKLNVRKMVDNIDDATV